MHLNLKGKTALVTGSTAGIGKAIAMSLAAEGATVLINGRREEKVNETVIEIHEKHPTAVFTPLSLIWELCKVVKRLLRSTLK